MWHKIVSPNLNFLNSTARGLFVSLLQQCKHRYLYSAVCALVLLTGASAAFDNQSLSQTLIASNAFAVASQAKAKRIVTLRHNDTMEGSRCTVTSDLQLDDYSSYVEGERFFVRVPQSTLAKAHGAVAGRGFTNMRVEQSGDDVVISFLLQLGATFHLNQSFNRLEINFLTNEHASKSK
ncbi:MAG: hypothetical protein DMF68_18265 [Acidobacteria bacterium]|nr:MAG: hypothetical protein DMF68_18265 [Acidobacteriota bacterium]